MRAGLGRGTCARLHAVFVYPSSFGGSFGGFPLHSVSAAEDGRSTPRHFNCGCVFKCNKRANTV